MRSVFTAALTYLAAVAAPGLAANVDRSGKPMPPADMASFLDSEARDAAREEAAKQELQRLQGTWSCIHWEEAGQTLGKDELRERSIFFGADVMLLRQNGKLIQVATQRLDPTRMPKMVTSTVSQGRHKGDVLLGIYELQGDTLKICFDVEGQQRPAEFKSASGTGLILAEYRRRPPHASEQLDLTGKYRSLSIQLDGSEHRADAVIQRRGDAYSISYMKGNAVTYVGVGIRKGNILSVCWANRGQAGISVYRIEDGPNLVGNYTELGGVGFLSREVLTFEDKLD